MTTPHPHAMSAVENIRAALAAVKRTWSLRAQKEFRLACSTKAITEVLAHIDAQQAEIERLKRGEFICQKCGLRRDADHPVTHDF